MELKELIESVFEEAYRLGRCDGENGIHVKPKVLFEHFISEFESKKDIVALLHSYEKGSFHFTNRELH